MNPPPNDDARLAALVRQSAPELADDGFSARVLTALPAREAVRRPRLRFVFCAAGAAAGIGFAYWQGASWSALREGLTPLLAPTARLVAVFADPGIVLALTVTAASLLFVYRPRTRATRLF